MSYYSEKGVPYINDTPATPCKEIPCVICQTFDSLMPWLCPVCGAHLDKHGFCLNICHLSPVQQERFKKIFVKE